MSFRSRNPGTMTELAGERPQLPENGWISVDLEEPGKPGDTAAPVGQPAPSFAPAEGGTEPLVETRPAPGAEADFVDSTRYSGRPFTATQLHGWLERMRPADPGFLSFERPRAPEAASEAPQVRRVPETDVVVVARSKTSKRLAP